MQKVHEAGLAHCDIKPENIMLLDDLSIKLCDFGAAVAIHPNTGRVAAMPAEIINMEQQFAWPEAAQSAQLESFGMSSSPASQTLRSNTLQPPSPAASSPRASTRAVHSQAAVSHGAGLGGELVLSVPESVELSGGSDGGATPLPPPAGGAELPAMRWARDRPAASMTAVPIPDAVAAARSYSMAVHGSAWSATATCTGRTASLAALTPYSLRKVSQVSTSFLVKQQEHAKLSHS